MIKPETSETFQIYLKNYTFYDGMSVILLNVTDH